MLTYANYRFTLCPTPLDGNGWFNKSHFDVNKWLSSLSSMALLLSQYPNAVAFDLRNELRTNSLDRVSQISDWMSEVYSPGYEYHTQCETRRTHFRIWTRL